jgi:hypothetical protein
MNPIVLSAFPPSRPDRAQRIADKVQQLVRASLEAQLRAVPCGNREQEMQARLRGVEQESIRLCAAALQRWSELRMRYRNEAEPTWSRLAAIGAATERGFYNQEGLLRALEEALKEETAVRR